METILYVFNKGLEAYEFLGVDEPLLHAWAKQSHSYKSVGFYPFNFSGFYGLSIDVSNYVKRGWLPVLER